MSDSEDIEKEMSQAEEASVEQQPVSEDQAGREESQPNPDAADVDAKKEGSSETTEESTADAAAESAAEAEPAQPEPAPVPTAPRCENPIVGRKVFFVNPPLYVENYLHLELKQHEYEVYIISDFRYTKAALRHFPDALCFIFIDDEMSYDEWFNFIMSFQKDEKLKTIFHNSSHILSTLLSFFYRFFSGKNRNNS